MDDDLLADADEHLADLVDQAFRLAYGHGGVDVGIAHLGHAMTSLAVGFDVLTAAGIDVGAVREAATIALLDGSENFSAHLSVLLVDVALDVDAETALKLAVERAQAAGDACAGIKDLLAVLIRYEPADTDLIPLVEALHGRDARAYRFGDDERGTATAWHDYDGDLTRHTWGASESVSHAANVSMVTMSMRLDAVEDRTAADHERIAHVVHELARHRERLPAADDWRSQMQDIVTQLDALKRQVRELERLAASIGGARNSARDRAPNRTREVMPHKVASEVHDLTKPVLSGPVAPASVSVSGEPDVIRRARVSSPPSTITVSADTASGRTTTSTNLSRGQRRLRRKDVAARARQRTSRRFGRLRYTSLARLGLRRRPARRERSWWRYLTDRNGWRAARSRGGRFRSFGERAGTRRRNSWSTRTTQPRPRDAAPRDARTHQPGTGEREKRFYLALDDDIVDAPSIGPKTAERLRPARIFTVRDLLAADAQEVARLVDARHVTPQAVRDWQDQARLVLTVPFLRGTHAQLLVGAGFRSLDALVRADQATLMAALLRFATTREGQSVLRNGSPPDVEKVVRWLENAQQAEPARAA